MYSTPTFGRESQRLGIYRALWAFLQDNYCTLITRGGSKIGKGV